MTRMRARLLAAGAGLGAGALCALVAWIAWPLPAGLTSPDPAPSLTLEDRHGLVLRTARAADGSLTRWLPLAEIDPKILQAFLALEDRRFYEHHGVDWRAVLRATRDNVRAGRIVSGGSTITMQLARLVVPGAAGHSWSAKLRQALWALRLERHLTKQAIFEQYLNRVPLGQGAVGVSAAAALYCNATAVELSLAQAALLAGLARAPSSDNPFVSAARARARRDLALARLRAAGYAREPDLARAAAEPLVARERTTPFLAPHFTTRLLAVADTGDERLAGTLRTSLDLGLQTALEAEVRHTVEVLGDRGVKQAAVVVLDNRSGELLAWVGSPDFWADTSGQVDMVISPRQPGSALKPFLYGLAFDRGLTPASILPDVPHTYQTPTGPYRPRNYDRTFHGPVRAREALASSYNIPAVELTDRLGAASLLRTLQLAGFGSLDRGSDYYGLGLALGNGDVTLLELANAFRALANGGVWRPYTWWAEPAPGGTERRVLSARAAALVLDVLADPVARIPGFGIDTPFDFPFPVAVKTGTSRHFTDNWAVGATAGFTVAVWAGNFSGRPMDAVSGVTGAGPLLRRAILLSAELYSPGVLTTPRAVGAVPVTICRLSGLRAGVSCPTAVEWFVPGTEPARDCDWHRGDGVRLPAQYAEWGADAAVAGPRGGSGQPLLIVSPRDGDRYDVPPGTDARYATIELRAGGGNGTIRWSVDGRPVSSQRWRLVPGAHTIRAVSGQGQSAVVRIEVEGRAGEP